MIFPVGDSRTRVAPVLTMAGILVTKNVFPLDIKAAVSFSSHMMTYSPGSITRHPTPTGWYRILGFISEKQSVTGKQKGRGSPVVNLEILGIGQGNRRMWIGHDLGNNQ